MRRSNHDMRALTSCQFQKTVLSCRYVSLLVFYTFNFTLSHMPNIKSAEKAMRQSAKRRIINLKTKDKYKDALRDFRKLVMAGKKSEAVAMLSQAASAIDKAAKKNVILKNKASRLKSRMAKSLKKLS